MLGEGRGGWGAAGTTRLESSLSSRREKTPDLVLGSLGTPHRGCEPTERAPERRGLASFLEEAAGGWAPRVASSGCPEQLLAPPGPRIKGALASGAMVSRETRAAQHTGAKYPKTSGPQESESQGVLRPLPSPGPGQPHSPCSGDRGIQAGRLSTRTCCSGQDRTRLWGLVPLPCPMPSWQLASAAPGTPPWCRETGPVHAAPHSRALWLGAPPQRCIRSLTPMSVPPASDRSLQRCQVRWGGTRIGPLQGRVSLQGGRFGHSELGPCDGGGRGAGSLPRAGEVGRPQRSATSALDVRPSPCRGCPRLWGLPQMLGSQDPPGLGIAFRICRQQLQVPHARAPLAAMLRARHPSFPPWAISVATPQSPRAWVQSLQGASRLLHEPCPRSAVSHPWLSTRRNGGCSLAPVGS